MIPSKNSSALKYKKIKLHSIEISRLINFGALLAVTSFDWRVMCNYGNDVTATANANRTAFLPTSESVDYFGIGLTWTTITLYNAWDVLLLSPW